MTAKIIRVKKNTTCLEQLVCTKNNLFKKIVIDMIKSMDFY